MVVTGVSYVENFDPVLMQARDPEINFEPYENDHNTTELVELTNTNQSCQNWNDYPFALAVASGAMVSGSPIICGGWSGLRGSGIRKQCYSMDIKKKSWEFLTNMTTKRAESASVAINASLFVTGGHYGPSGPLSSTEYIHKNGSASAGPNLPSPRAGHCMVNLPSSNIMIIGGYASRRDDFVGLNNLQTNLLQNLSLL